MATKPKVQSKPKALKKYVVFKTNLKDHYGVKCGHGDVVELSEDEARIYGKRGFLKPYFGDNVREEIADDENDLHRLGPSADDTDDDEETPLDGDGETDDPGEAGTPPTGAQPAVPTRTAPKRG